MLPVDRPTSNGLASSQLILEVAGCSLEHSVSDLHPKLAHASASLPMLQPCWPSSCRGEDHGGSNFKGSHAELHYHEQLMTRKSNKANSYKHKHTHRKEGSGIETSS